MLREKLEAKLLEVMGSAQNPIARDITLSCMELGARVALESLRCRCETALTMDGVGIHMKCDRCLALASLDGKVSRG